MNIKTLFKKFEERRVIIDNHPGRWVLWSDIEKIFDELKTEVVKIPQEIADWIEFFKERGYKFKVSTNPGAYCGVFIIDEFKDEFPNINFLKTLSWICENIETYARAWNEGYIVKESKYVVTDGNHLYFKGYQEDVDIVILADEQPGTIDYVKKFDTREEAQKVADILGWKIQEVV